MFQVIPNDIPNKENRMENTRKSSMKGFYLATFLIGLGFFTMGLMDPLYDSFVPVFLADYIGSKGFIGIVMTLDNIFALFMIPLFSALSDRTSTRIGRRMPYILVTLPLSAVMFSLIPFAAAVSLAVLIVTLFGLNIFKQAARGPVVALMPDTVPGEYRSEANGVINTMGNIAAIIGTVVLGRLMDLSIELPIIGNTERKLPFVIAGFLVIVAVVLLFAFVREKQRGEPERAREPILKSIAYVFSPKNRSDAGGGRSALFILVSLLLWFLGYQGVVPFLTLYNIEVLGVSAGTAALSPGVFAISSALFAIPSGMVAHRVGRKKAIRFSLAVITGIAVLIFLHYPITRALGLSQFPSLVLFWVFLALFGAFWITVVANSFPMLWQMAGYETIGIYTGLYYFFSQTASILAPPVTGGIIDLFGFRMIFLFMGACMLAAFFTMSRVTGGEPHEDARS
jgi:maltose/moltooligosaccharide transporter